MKIDKRQRLEHHAFGEAAGTDKHRGHGESPAHLGVAVDIAAEAEIAQ